MSQTNSTIFAKTPTNMTDLLIKARKVVFELMMQAYERMQYTLCDELLSLWRWLYDVTTPV